MVSGSKMINYFIDKQMFESQLVLRAQIQEIEINSICLNL